ncbi:MAG: cyclic nucleotide-binding domain-containing protein [Betaproteobacteria bacterium]
MTTVSPMLYDAVRACPLAAELTPEQTEVLASLVNMESHQPKDVLANEGTSGNRLYMIVEGSLGVVKHRDKPDETLLTTLVPGDFAHELGFLDGAERYASLVALTKVRVLVLEREKLETLIDTQPLVLYRVMCAIVRTVHRIQTRLSVQTNELTNYITKQHGRY